MPTMVCGKCGASLPTVDVVIQHAETAHPVSHGNAPGDILCPGCPATFRQILQLKRHLAQAHGM